MFVGVGIYLYVLFMGRGAQLPVIRRFFCRDLYSDYLESKAIGTLGVHDRRLLLSQYQRRAHQRAVEELRENIGESIDVTFASPIDIETLCLTSHPSWHRRAVRIYAFSRVAAIWALI